MVKLWDSNHFYSKYYPINGLRQLQRTFHPSEQMSFVVLGMRHRQLRQQLQVNPVSFGKGLAPFERCGGQGFVPAGTFDPVQELAQACPVI